MNWISIFLTGLTSGGLSCLAVQGGLVASVIANQKDDELEEADKNTSSKKKVKEVAATSAKSFDALDWLPITVFLVGKLISHTILGLLLGFLGSKLELSLGIRLGFQLAAALFMLATAANLLELHPIFRYVLLQPPKFLTRMIRNTSKSKAVFTPFVLGLMTIFIPCGVTQSMEVLAISTANPILGAAIMFVFVLGTSPLFGILGVGTAKLSEIWKGSFLKIAAATLVFLAASSMNGILVVMDAPVTFQKVMIAVLDPAGVIYADSDATQAVVAKGTQKVTINVTSSGYSPRNLAVKAGVPVELTLKSGEVYSCASYFVFPEFGIKTQLKQNDLQTFKFTPTKKGRFTYSCSMGMYTGVMEVL